EVRRLLKPFLPTLKRLKIRDASEEEANQLGLGPAVGEFFDTLPFFFDEKGINQAAAQPCSVAKGVPHSAKPCRQRKLQPFTRTEGYYSSGFIPYLGENGNEFDMKIADNAKPGEYTYYCALHGPGMSGSIIVTTMTT